MNRLLIAAVVLTLTACDGGEHRDLQRELQEMTQDMRGRVDPLPTVKPYEPYAYSSFNVAEPFAPGKIKLDNKAGASSEGANTELAVFHQNRAKEPLEAYPLESLKMVGVLARGRDHHALVRADAGLYRIRVGNYMGQNFGVVTKIGDGEIVLKELIQDGSGDWAERSSSLLLQEAEVKK